MGYFLFSFGFSALAILILLFVVARHEAEFSGRVMLITPVVLCVVELAGNVFWTLLWQGVPDRFFTLGSVMAGVFVVGCVLVYKIHIVGAVKSAFVMMLYVLAKSVFVIVMAYTYLFPMGVYTPTPFSAWYIGESWRGREIAGVRAEFPGEFLAMSYNRHASEKLANGRYTVAKAFEADFGTYRVRVAQVHGVRSWIDPSIDFVSVVGFLLQQDKLEKGDAFRDSSPFRAEYDVSDIPGERLKSEYSLQGAKQEVDAVFVSEDYFGWLILVDGNRGEVQGVSTRIFNTLEIPEESRKRAEKESKESREPDTEDEVVPDNATDPGMTEAEEATSVYPFERIIKNREGNEIEVKIVGRTESRLIFEMKDGRIFKYLIRDLSPEDQEFVKGLPVSQN